MKVFNLACEHDHQFEGWFASAEDYDSQLARGLMECPMCGNKAVRKLLSAPRLNLTAAPVAVEKTAVSLPDAAQLQAMWVKMAQHIVQSTEDVGERFAEEARKIHYREAPSRGIRGVTTTEQASALEDEGIEVFSFPMPKALKEPLQ